MLKQNGFYPGTSSLIHSSTTKSSASDQVLSIRSRVPLELMRLRALVSIILISGDTISFCLVLEKVKNGY